MTSISLKLPIQTIETLNHSFNLRLAPSDSRLVFHSRRHLHWIPIFFSKPQLESRTVSFSPQCSTSKPTPPTSQEDAILQAKISLASALEKPLNNPKLAAGKLKKVKQPRFRVEIPVLDDSASPLTQLAVGVFGELPIKRKVTTIKILVLWPNQSLAQAATRAFESASLGLSVNNIDLSAVLDEDTRTLNSADAAVFLAPEVSQLALMKTVTDMLNPKPVVMFNPRWAFEEERDFGGLSSFADSFDVVYSFLGLEVRGLLSKRKGVIFKCARNGVLSGERWSVLVEEGDELKVVSSFKNRPSMTEVENVLYNLMAINSPITKSAKFLKELVSNVSGKK